MLRKLPDLVVYCAGGASKMPKQKPVNICTIAGFIIFRPIFSPGAAAARRLDA